MLVIWYQYICSPLWDASIIQMKNTCLKFRLRLPDAGLFLPQRRFAENHEKVLKFEDDIIVFSTVLEECFQNWMKLVIFLEWESTAANFHKFRFPSTVAYVHLNLNNQFHPLPPTHFKKRGEKTYCIRMIFGK